MMNNKTREEKQQAVQQEAHQRLSLKPANRQLLQNKEVRRGMDYKSFEEKH